MPITADSLGSPWAIHCPTPLKPGGVREQLSSQHAIDIIDIRRAEVEINLKEDIHAFFNPEHGPRRLPTLLLYDERGLQLFEKITYLDEYYLTNYEIEVLKRYAAEIVQQIPSGSMVIELGSGNLRKVLLLLQAFENAGKGIDYYALDLSKRELERTLSHVPNFKYVRCHGLHGTYDDGREWLKKPANLARQKCLLNLGSSIGNFERDEAAAFLRNLADVLRPTDTMLIGLDACQDPSKVYHAYNDDEGITHQFVLNGLRHANHVLGEQVFDEANWKVIGEYVYDDEGGRHQAFYSPRRDVTVMGTLVRKHERIQVEQSLKYSHAESKRLWNLAGIAEIARWSTAGDDYGLHLLAKPRMPFSTIPSVYAGTALPTLGDWQSLWEAWDVVTRGMLPHEELLGKPIRLRNACIFYLGHIPTFLDIQLSKTTKEPLTEPAFYKTIFERGVDPDVDNPELCHDHSEIPDEWPPVEEILAYQGRVRARLQTMYSDGVAKPQRCVGRAIWISFEHEVMHLETLLYMLLQSDKTLPPSIAERPNFEKMAENARVSRVENKWFHIPAQTITIGIDDPEDGTDPARHYGWDNEKPQRQVHVASFQAQGRPITNEEYAQYMYNNGIYALPTSWAELETRNGALKEQVNGSGTHITGHTNGHSNGYTNGCADGFNSGNINGSGNEPVNGYASDHGNGNANGTSSLPEHFIENMAVRTVYGLVPLKHALDWPIFASYDELSRCASWMGGRIPTFEEARSLYEHAKLLKKRKEVERTLGKTVPAVNSHLVNNGVQETPPKDGLAQVDEVARNDLFIDLDGANVGFQHWHPVPVTGSGDRLCGQSELGGVWEWTSSLLAKHEGFEPMSLYPGYTADFFDGKHNIVLGGSWATHPRIAGRKSFVNWYQRNYPYAWIGARLVRDA